MFCLWCYEAKRNVKKLSANMTLEQKAKAKGIGLSLIRKLFGI